MSWLAWVAGGVAALAGVGTLAARSYRASLRRGLREYLSVERPGLRIVEETSEHFRLVDENSSEVGTLHFRRLYEVAPKDEAERVAAYRSLVGALDQAATMSALTPAQRDAVMPRIINAPALTALQGREGGTPSLPLGVADLHVVLVLDGEHSVAYLGDAELEALGLDLDQGLRLAQRNLGATFDEAIVERALRAEDTVVVKSGDTYDAARLLLVPERLGEGDVVAAAIPDRDTLVLLGAPTPEDWKLLESLAQTTDGDPLCTVPLRVTRDGIGPRG